MKEIRETKLVEKTTVTFVANDGTVFSEEAECAAYERRLDEEMCAKRFKEIHIGSFEPPLVKWYYGEDAGADIVHLESEKDYDIMMDYYYSVKNKYTEGALPRKHEVEYPLTCIVTYGEEWVHLSNITIEKLCDQYIKANDILRAALQLHTNRKETDNKTDNN